MFIRSRWSKMSAIHKKYLRSFIPRSHRPYIRGIHQVDLFSTLPLAAAILDHDQRKLLMDIPNILLELSEEGNNLLGSIKAHLHACK